MISSEATLGEYVKALVKLDRLDSSALVQTLQVPSLMPFLRLATDSVKRSNFIIGRLLSVVVMLCLLLGYCIS